VGPTLQPAGWYVGHQHVQNKQAMIKTMFLPKKSTCMVLPWLVPIAARRWMMILVASIFIFDCFEMFIDITTTNLRQDTYPV
jgi:hypothetical protein